MGIIYSDSKLHWNYYLTIEVDFSKISRYIEFCEANSNTFSIELARIIMSATAEIDVLMKKICAFRNQVTDNIHDYREVINKEFPDFKNHTVYMPYYGMENKPWDNWNEKKGVPIWWTANNKIKHERGDNFDKANLKNAFNALGALLLTEYYYHKLLLEKDGHGTISWTEVTRNYCTPYNSLLKLDSSFYHEW